jgi:hypothetical protein
VAIKFLLTPAHETFSAGRTDHFFGKSGDGMTDLRGCSTTQRESKKNPLLISRAGDENKTKLISCGGTP